MGLATLGCLLLPAVRQPGDIMGTARGQQGQPQVPRRGFNGDDALGLTGG